MKPLQASLKLAVLVGIATISAAFGAKNTQIQTLAAEQVSTVLLREISIPSTFPKTSEKSPAHQDVQLMAMPLGGSSASTVVAASSGGAIVVIFLIVGVIVTVGAIAAILRPREIAGLVTISEDEVGIAIKKFTLIRRTRSHQLVALNKETGVQAKTLDPGRHWGYWSWMYTIRKVPVIRISPDEIGLVEAKDGQPLPSEKMFGEVVECNNFQDAEAFIKNGGRMGKQLIILRAGIYRINTELFSIRKESVIRISPDEVGLVFANDGAPMKPEQKFGRAVECNNFQDAEAFIKNGGQMGKQLAILRAGTYRINTELFSIRKEPVIRILPEEVGLVVASDGAPMKPGQMFGRVVECNNFQDAQAFIDKGGQQGKQLAILTAGIYQINTELFSIRKEPIIRVPQRQIVLVVANEGAPLPSGRILGDVVECDNFQDAQAFIDNGGQQGRQLAILTSGAYQINTDLFTVITAANATQHGLKPEQLQVDTVEPDKIGIVTTHDGLPLPEGQIAGTSIEGHKKFQDAQKFIARGGYRGLQEEVLTEGSWYLNPWFVTIEQVPVTKIEAGTVGVVVSSVGKEPEQDIVDSQTHSTYELVERGCKGVWKTPLKPRDHHINTRIMRVEIVPTHEIRLNWSDDDSKPEYNYDKNLQALELRSKDQYSFKVELTQHISIAEEDAPKMISKIGSLAVEESKPLISISSEPVKKYRSIKNLVTRVLAPLVSAYFQDSAQDYNALDFRRERGQRQTEATNYIKGALNAYGVQAMGTFITKIDLPDHLDPFIQRITEAELERDALEKEELTERKRKELELTRKKGELEITKLKITQEAQRISAEAEWNQLMNQVELGALREKTQIEAELQRLLSEVDVNALRQTIETLSPELYAKIEESKAWARGFGDFKGQLVPNTLVNTSGNGSGTSDASQALSQLLTTQLLHQVSQQHPNQQLSSSPTPELPIAAPTEPPKLESSSLKATEPRCPVLLLLDTSSSMSGECIHKLNAGIAAFKQEMAQDTTASLRVEVAIITFDSSVQTVQNFATINQFSIPQLTASGQTAMGQALELALKKVESLKETYNNNNIQHHKPWVFLIIGSPPTDSWQNAAQQVRQAVEGDKLNFFVVGIRSANMITLRQIAPPNFPPVMLDGLKFGEMFHWLSDSIKKVASSEVGSTVDLPPITGWAWVNV